MLSTLLGVLSFAMFWFVFCHVRSSGHQLGCTAAAASAQQPVERAKIFDITSQMRGRPTLYLSLVLKLSPCHVSRCHGRQVRSRCGADGSLCGYPDNVVVAGDSHCDGGGGNGGQQLADFTVLPRVCECHTWHGSTLTTYKYQINPGLAWWIWIAFFSWLQNSRFG